MELDDDAWRDVFEAKLLGSVRPVRAALPALVEQGAGSIVLISGEPQKVSTLLAAADPTGVKVAPGDLPKVH